MKGSAVIKALSEFSSQKEIPFDEGGKFTQTLLDGDDAAAAILAATTLERTLYNLLLAGMCPLNAEERKRLFGDRGPLSSFASKIWIAFAFGLIDAATATHLEYVRVIRNAFAHSLRPISFSTKEVSDATNLFEIHVTDTAPAASRERFLFTFVSLTRQLGGYYAKLHENPPRPSLPQIQP